MAGSPTQTNKHKKETQMNIQQGDLLMRTVSRTPWTGFGKQGKQLVLLTGETTGHAHVIECEEEAELIEIGGRMLLNLESAGVLRHEEHKAIEVPAGTYEVGQAQEFDVGEQVVRLVQD
jgi:hypothetical protein